MWSDSFAFLQRFGGAGDVAGQARRRDFPHFLAVASSWLRILFERAPAPVLTNRYSGVLSD